MGRLHSYGPGAKRRLHPLLVGPALAKAISLMIDK